MEKENFLNDRYQFRYNEILNRTFYRNMNSQDEFILLQAYKLNSIKRELNNQGINATLTDIKCLLESDFVPKYSPFKEYFKNLKQWDNVDYIEMLAETISTTKNEDFKWAFKKWLVAFVACAINEETTNQGILILTGKQGIGKTTWLKKLVPMKLGEYFFSGNVNPNNKDSTLLLSEKLLINLDELASLNKKQIEAFKEMVTKSVISERRAYGQFTENYIRRASFVGSSNHNEILMDVTGNRRFLCFEATDIDYNHTINMDLVYSQVMHLINTDFKFHFDGDDIKRLEENNKMFTQSSEENDWIDELFSIPDDSEFEFMNATEIVQYIKSVKRISSNIDVIAIGKIMTSKNFQKKKVNQIYKYIVKKNIG